MITKLSKTFLLLFLVGTLIISCNAPEKPATLASGIWRGTLDVQGNELPFNFEVVDNKGKQQIYLINDKERLLLDTLSISGDSLYLPMHIFDADIKAVISGGTISGMWTKNYADDYSVPFEAVHDVNYRFEKTENTPSQNFTGSWEITFIHEEDTTEAIFILEQIEEKITGTILTPTGDYRYLEGQVNGDELSVSTFDGGHAFLFKAKTSEDGNLSGDFWSGKRWHETWTAIKNDSAKLPDADKLTYLNPNYDSVYFEFPDLNGNIISPSDAKYDGKVLILQIFGTWCPNCMDETKFLKAWYDENNHRDVEILGLAYEAKDDYDYAKNRVFKMKRKLGVRYDYVIAGTDDKDEASKTLPMLNHISSFPTTIFIDKKGKVRRIHTGFTGPGTGPYYEQFIKEFNNTVDELITE